MIIHIRWEYFIKLEDNKNAALDIDSFFFLGPSYESAMHKRHSWKFITFKIKKTDAKLALQIWLGRRQLELGKKHEWG